MFELMTLSGSEFQMVGATTEKARLAKTVGVREMASSRSPLMTTEDDSIVRK